MSRIAYVNGRYVPFASAFVHVEDRGYQLADGVYEVIAVWEGRPIDLVPHLQRLGQSLAELRLEWPVGKQTLRTVLHSVVERNYIRKGIVYIQISRGVYKRKHIFPPKGIRTTLVVTAHSYSLLASATLFEQGVSVITLKDLRWQRCDIKSLTLLPNVLSRQIASETGAFEAWLLASDGTITEGTSSTAWIVTHRGHVITRPLSQALLRGITRERVLALANLLGIAVVERPFTLEETKHAAEAFLTSTTAFILPVVTINGKQIQDGRPGAVTRRLRTAYLSSLTSGAAIGW